tara:strand:- start:22018 stop:23574 length:1557 start_codon:yes stop_codon:yes gene_type:complete
MKTAIQLIALAGSVPAALAQPFVHNIGEPTQSRELCNDLTILSGDEIASVGSISFDTANLTIDGYVLVADPDGDALVSWIVEDPDAQRHPLIAAREDPDDKQLIVLEDAVLSPSPIDTDLILFKIDPFTGVLGYQIRYDDAANGRNLGMELDGQTGLVAASVYSTAGDTQPTLLRFRNASGMPVFHFRYATLDFPAFNARFFDVAVDPDSGDIFAVGSVLLDVPTFTPESELLVARFTAAGIPIWFNAYEIRVENNDDAGPTEGASIEFTAAGLVAVTARVGDPNFGPLSAHLVLDPLAGAPTAAAALANPQAAIDPATSSLELRPDGTMLVSGTLSDVTGRPFPAMWTFDAGTAAFNWAWVPDVEDGAGHSAIPQGPRGPLLGGIVFPPLGPIGGLRDVLLARTPPSGDGLCPKTPDLRELDVNLARLSFPVIPIEMPDPSQAGLAATPGDPVRRFVCRLCPADLAPPFGVLNFFDIAAYIALYNAMDPAADLAPPFGVWNFFDIAEYIAQYNAGCP